MKNIWTQLIILCVTFLDNDFIIQPVSDGRKLHVANCMSAHQELSDPKMMSSNYVFMHFDSIPLVVHIHQRVSGTLYWIKNITEIVNTTMAPVTHKAESQTYM